MKHLINFRPGVLLAAGFGVGLLLSGASELLIEAFVPQARAQEKTASKSNNLEGAPPGLQTPGGGLRDQAHAMVDVGYHFANLWFAADKRNWPLADYYLGETRSHLRWAVRIHPVRKTKAGAEVDLNGILDAVDNSFLAEVGKAIENKDAANFETAYIHTLEGCYACHKACEKPFLRLKIPSAASVSILGFDPNATWPK
jgi:hypothetical protein